MASLQRPSAQRPGYLAPEALQGDYSPAPGHPKGDGIIFRTLGFEEEADLYAVFDSASSRFKCTKTRVAAWFLLNPLQLRNLYLKSLRC